MIDSDDQKISNPAICAALELKAAQSGDELLFIISEWCYINGIEFETFAEDIATPNIIYKLANEQLATGRLENNKRLKNLLLKLRCDYTNQDCFKFDDINYDEQ